MRSMVEGAGLAAEIEIDSAGTSAYHEGERADARSRQEAERHGVELTSISRQFTARDFARFDYVLAMDRRNLRDLAALTPDAGERAKLRLLRSFAPEGRGHDVPDPYHGGERGFANVYAICEAACRGLLAHLIETHRLT
jgi:protein-tyrosine phosphatase